MKLRNKRNRVEHNICFIPIFIFKRKLSLCLGAQIHISGKEYGHINEHYRNKQKLPLC